MVYHNVSYVLPAIKWHQPGITDNEVETIPTTVDIWLPKMYWFKM